MSANIRFNRTDDLILDDFTENEDLAPKLEGSLIFTDEHDDQELIFVSVGTTQIGFIPKRCLVAAAEKIVELWKEKVVET
jgi:hypothetical protein